MRRERPAEMRPAVMILENLSDLESSLSSRCLKFVISRKARSINELNLGPI